jgi:OmpA-OmpF porin, OOP family
LKSFKDVLRSLTVALVGVSTLGAASAAFAQASEPSGFYLAAGFGQSRIDVGGTTQTRSGVSGTFGVGYRLNSVLAVEFSYIEFGSAQLFQTNAEVKSTSASVLVSAPFAETFSVYGRLGGANSDRRVTTSGRVLSDERKSEAVYGVGAAYSFNKNLTTNLEWTKLNDSKASIISLGLRYYF